MPFEFQIHEDRQLMSGRVWGALTEELLLRFRDEVTADPAFDPGHRQLVDYSEVTSFELSAAFLRRLSEDDPWDPDTRRAIVAPRDVVFGSARMYSLLLGAEQTYGVFRSREEALEWLDGDPDEPPPDAPTP